MAPATIFTNDATRTAHGEPHDVLVDVDVEQLVQTVPLHTVLDELDAIAYDEFLAAAVDEYIPTLEDEQIALLATLG